MPEYNDFESIDNTDLVNLATGDMAYTIPVMTVPGPGLGFPLVLNYHAGIQPEQEASWVGLGWNLEAGAITRQINNVPDDFRGTPIEELISSQEIHGWMASIAWNGATVGISWDSEVGLGGMVGYSYGIKGTPISVGGTAGVNGVYEGIGISVGFSGGSRIGENTSIGAGMSIGVHSKRGVTAGFSAGVSLTSEVGTGQDAIQTSASLASVGVSLSSSKGQSAGASAGVGFASSASVSGQADNSSANLWIPIWTPWTGYMEINFGTWDSFIDGFQEDLYYGFLYSDVKGMGCEDNPKLCYKTIDGDHYTRCRSCNDKPRLKKMDYNNPMDYLRVPSTSGDPLNDPDYQKAYFKLGYTGEDIYSVQTQGLSGTFRPYRAEDGDYYSYVSNQDYAFKTGCKMFMGYVAGDCDRSGTVEFGPFYEGGDPGIEQRNRHTSDNGIVWRFNEEEGGALYTNPLTRDAGPLVAAASKRIEPIFAGNAIEGWMVTKSDGTRYLYGNSQYNFVQQSIGSKNYDLSEATRREMPPYAYAWLLTAILSPDYVPIGNTGRTCVTGSQGCEPRDGDLGGWVRFTYSPNRIVSWKTPVDRTSEPGGFNPNMSSQNYTVSMGYKSISYLESIITPSHIAIMNRADDSRKDGIPPAMGEIGIPITDIEQLSDALPPAVTPSRCTDTEVHEIPRHNYKVTVENADKTFPKNTMVTLIARRRFSWTRWDCEWSWSNLSLTCGQFCQEGSQDQVVDHFPLPDPVDNKYVFTIENSTEIESVRMVIGKIESGQEASRLSYLRGITLKNRAFGAEGTEVGSVRFAYDYSLAQGTPNSESSKAKGDGGNSGRLTLKAVQMGATSNGPWTPPYTFAYYSTLDGDGTEILYNRSAKDFWGYYCAACNQGRQRPDGKANAWNLKTISNPSGSKVELTYEPKTADYVEGVPAVIEGSKIYDYFLPEDHYIVESGDTRNWRFQDLNYLYKPIADYVQGKYLIYLGRFEGRPNGGPDPDLDTYDFGPVQTHPGIAAALARNPSLAAPEYLVEGAVTNETDNEFRRGFVDAARTGTLNFNDGFGSPPLVVGQLKKTIFTAGKINRVFPNNPWKDRVWAIFNQKPDFLNYQGGVRVSQVKFTEPFIGKTNVVRYKYEESATPTLPESFSNYELSLKYRDATGIKAYLGNPAILHGKVTATYRIDDTHEYSTEYRFVTSKDLPIRIIPQKIPGYAPGNELQAKVKILDRSGLWGSLWKKTDRNSSNEVVRTVTSAWTARIPTDLKANFGLASENLGVALDGAAVLIENAPKTSVMGPGDNEKKYFGMTQKLWSNRFVPAPCEESSFGPAKRTCLTESHGAQTAQIELARFAPFQRYQYSSQDGVQSVSETNLFDFLTGDPLLQIARNKSAQGDQEFITTFTSRAYQQSGLAYGLMKERNMLTQEFSKTTFKFSEDPTDKFPDNLGRADLDKVAASEVFAWGDFWHEGTATHRFRQYQNFVLRDRSGFELPTPSTDYSAKWFSSGATQKYDDFGHVLDFKAPSGTHASQVIGYRNSLPTAFAQNARFEELFYQSFETDEYKDVLLPGYANHSKSGKRSRTGKAALLVINCKEAEGKCAAGDQNTMVCFDLPSLPTSQTYVASAWYYDEYKGSNPDDPFDNSYLTKPIKVTRPGLFIGDPDGLAGCHEEIHPNGVLMPSVPGFVPPLGNLDPRAGQRAMGEKDWKRLSLQFTPGPGCGSQGKMTKAWLCIYASKGKAGSDVYYDEVRVRPKSSLMTTYAYDAKGKIISSADANEVASHYEYDAFGNLTGIRNDEGKLLNEQSKRFADPAVTYKIHRGGVFSFGNLPEDGCENFDIVSDPAGHDVSFTTPVIDPPAGSTTPAAIFKMKSDAQGHLQPSLCYQNYDPFVLKVKMNATGTVQSLPVEARKVPSISITGCTALSSPKYLSDLKASDENKCLELAFRGTDNLYTSSASILKPSYLGIVLPTEAELRLRGGMAALDNLSSYRIQISFPQGIAPGGAGPGSGSSPTDYPFHLRVNYFDDVGFKYKFYGTSEEPTGLPKRHVGEDYVMTPNGYSDLGKAFTAEYLRPASKPFTTNEMLGPISQDASVVITKPNYFAFALYANGYVFGTGLWPLQLLSSDRSNKIKDIKVTITPVTTLPN